MMIRCECGAKVTAANVNLAAAIATCEACGAVFSIAQRPAAASTQRVIPSSFAAPSHLGGPAPIGYRDTSKEGSARWHFRWFRPHHLFMVLFLVFWNGISFTFVFDGLSGGGLGLLSLLIPHPWIGVALSYWTLAHLFNRTTITLTANELTVRSGPIPWPSLQCARSDIARFDTTRGWGNRGQGQHQVRVVGKDQRARRVLGNMTEEEASYLAGELEDALTHAE